MEVMVPVMAPSAPCSPRTAAIAGGDHLPGYCYFFSSAPTSPSRASYAGDASPGAAGDEATFDFTLGFSGQLQEATPILADADELFEGGRIRPLNTPHPSILLVDDTSSTSNYSSCTGACFALKTEVAKVFMTTVIDHELVDPNPKDYEK
jgi:hypothetical protein